jgi:hypothetical protein
MQGIAVVDRELLDAESVCGHLVPTGSVFAFLADHRRVLFPDGMFADLFPSRTGRPSVPADVMASVIVLQTLHGLSDREAVEALRCDLRWKVGCGLGLADEGFHPSTLTYWRRRLAASARPNRIFGAVKEVVAGTGCWLAVPVVRWIRRFWMMRSPPRTPLPSSSRPRAGSRVRFPARPS